MWFAIDDHFREHRKVLRLRRSAHFTSAIALWTLAGTWAAGDPEGSIDGRVPIDVLCTAGVDHWQEALDALVDVGLWTCDGEHVTFHDWSTWNGPQAKHHRSTEQTRLRTVRYRMQRCRDGNHDRHCPKTDDHGQPWSCSKREAKEAGSRAGAAGDVTPGTGTGTGTGTGSSTEAHNEWGDVPDNLRTPANVVQMPRSS